jgi:hypothetical protein
MIDHLVYAVPDLDAAVADLAARWGVQATPGGSHPGRGTRNALIALGNDAYLEVIGPDPDQLPPPGPLAFGIDRARPPRLATWAAKAPDIEQRVAAARAAGYDPGDVLPRSRATPDGTLLEWRLTRSGNGDGLVPFLIDWGTTRHPSTTSAGGCTLVEFRAEHPDPDAIRRMLAAIGVDLPVTGGPAPALAAVIDTPKGRAELR